MTNQLFTNSCTIEFISDYKLVNALITGLKQEGILSCRPSVAEPTSADHGQDEEKPMNLFP